MTFEFLILCAVIFVGVLFIITYVHNTFKDLHRQCILLELDVKELFNDIKELKETISEITNKDSLKK